MNIAASISNRGMTEGFAEDAKHTFGRVVMTPRCKIYGKFMRKLDFGESRCIDAWQAEPQRLGARLKHYNKGAR